MKPRNPSKARLRTGFKSVKQKIEETPQIGTHEMLWRRSKPGELKPAALYRFPHGIEPKPVEPTDKSDLHTHPFSEKMHLKSGLPSYRDVEVWAEMARTSNLRSFHIAILNSAGKVGSYFHCRFTKRFLEAMKNPQKEEEFFKAITAAEFHPSEIEKLLEFLTKNKYAVFHRQTMAGHQFNPKTGRAE